MPPATGPALGRIVSIEGLNGVGKTYLTNQVVEAARQRGDTPPVVIEEFSRRATGAHGTDLGRQLLRALVDASHGERFLRAGYPKSETLTLLAIKMHDYETALPALAAGETVIEGRSIHSTAVYQSLILHPDDGTTSGEADAAAHAEAVQILAEAARWRPLPDLTILLTDDVGAAVHRAEARNEAPFSAEQWHLHHRAARLFERLAADDPRYVRLLDRREHDVPALVDRITEWIAAATPRPSSSAGFADQVSRAGKRAEQCLDVRTR